MVTSVTARMPVVAEPPGRGASARASSPATSVSESSVESAPPVVVSLSESAASVEQASTTQISSKDAGVADRLAAASRSDSGQYLQDQIAEALDKILWLLKALGMKPDPAMEARAKAGEAAQNQLQARQGGGSVQTVINSTDVVSMQMRNVDITVQQGDSSVSVSVGSVSLVRHTDISVEQQVKKVDPLVVDLTGKGIELTPPDQGKSFDIEGNGTPEQTAWVKGGTALLAMDSNGDGTVTSGKQLFGQANGAADGFGELAKLDGNHDGVIDSKDQGFRSLLLVHEGGRIDHLTDEGIVRIRLDSITPMNKPAGGGVVVASSLFERADGSKGTVGDALFDVKV